MSEENWPHMRLKDLDRVSAILLEQPVAHAETFIGFVSMIHKEHSARPYLFPKLDTEYHKLLFLR